MTSTTYQPAPAHQRPLACAVGALLLAATLGFAAPAQAQAGFAKPDQAADALINALATNDPAEMARVLGKRWRQLMDLGEVDIEDRYAFLEKSSQSRKVEVQGGRAALVVGTDPWTLPIPLVQTQSGQWRFDPVAARDEIALIRIGANERAAMQAALAYVDAQREYALADRNGDGVLEYATRFLSRPGQRDGLIWSPQLGDESPLGEAYLPAKPGQGYHGYRFRILTAQGPQAPGGARHYIIGGRMVNGYALVAWPLKYGETGVMSFIVNQSGLVYERDLGPRTTAAAAAIKLFNPDAGWKPARP